MIGRLRRSADFQRLLATPMRSRSAHFAVHHLDSGPSASARTRLHAPSTELSTDGSKTCPPSVDECPGGHWLGSLIPKRLARRAVTRNALRRQIRCAMQRHLRQLPEGLWLVRLRAPFAREQFRSAASAALRAAARDELNRLFESAAS